MTTSATPPFDLVNAALEPGVTLLEASAGTGKTYTLAGIFFRLVTEQDFTPGQILVSTYTEAATAELRDRIRRLLRSGWIAAGGGETGEAFLHEWFATERVPRALARERLAAALRNFDEAAIHTIHGFCQRMLQDRAFESGLVFNAELITDQEPLLRELADDFWRAHFHLADPVVPAMALVEKLDACWLARLLGEVVSHRLLRILPEGPAFNSAAAELTGLFAELRAQWPRWRDAVRVMVCEENQWAKPTFVKNGGANLAFAEECIDDPEACTGAYAALDDFATESIHECTGSKKTSPKHPFFDLCSQLRAARQTLRLAIETDFLTWARAELPRRKIKANIITFDDLLTRLHAALHSASGEALAGIVRGRFRAALIDEFQDTDAVQDAIFRKLFRDGTSRLFLIGDPKQAIYGFRGADVFTYLDAAADAPRFQLGTNYRSTTPLVAAVNAVFNRSPRAFVIGEIRFDGVQASGRADSQALQDGKRPLVPFQVWAWHADDPITVTKANETLPGVVAAEAARMLSSGIRLAGRPLLPSDFAVLVASNRQARLVQDALNQAGIPSVLLTDASVFHSEEARELQTLLAAIAEPSRESLIRAALATEALGSTAAEIEALQRDEPGWEGWLLRFYDYHHAWRDAGFISMFRRILHQEKIRLRLLRGGDGERRLTNYLHLGELLHHAASERRLGPSALLAWFAGQRNSSRPGGDNHELRLERDEDAVQITTIHKSKGLEYGIVFCPFSWGHAELRKKQRIFFHEEAAGRPLVLDLGSDLLEQNAKTALRERMAEHTRLLYVALTRARLQTHFVCGRFKGHAISAANWVLHPTHADDDSGTMRANFEALSAGVWRKELDALATESPEAISVVDLPSGKANPRGFSPPAKQAPVARKFRGNIARDWCVSSFSSLTIARDSEQPDHDPQILDGTPARDTEEDEGIHAFPRGKKAGSCLHEIFEELDFTQADEIEPLVRRKLSGFSFGRPEWVDAVAECVRKTLRTPLHGGFTLGQVQSESRLVELEFYLPVRHLTAEQLLHKLGPDAASGLRFDPRRGMLKGFIDLVVRHGEQFFIIDWKSNHLGSSAEAYHHTALAGAIRQHHYSLQYHLYTLALHRYLALRLPGYNYETHFGGVFYVFLRGIDPDQRDQGVFRARPERERIEQLSDYLAGAV